MFPHRPLDEPSLSALTVYTALQTPSSSLSSPPSDIKVECYGHRCVQLADTQILCFGGFGIDLDRNHRRLSTASLIQMNGDSMSRTVLPAFEDTMYHSMTKLSDNRFFFIGGRKSPKTTITKYGIWEVTENDIRPIVVQDSLNSMDSMEMTSRWRHSTVLFKGCV